LFDVDRPTLEAVCRMLHRAGAFEGLDEHVQAIRAYGHDLRGRPAAADDSDDEAVAEAALADTAAHLLEQVGRRLAAWPQRAPRAEHLAALRSAVAACGFRPIIMEARDRNLASRDLACLAALDAIVAEMTALNEYAPSAALTAAEFLAELEEAMDAVSVTPPRRPGGAVQILDTRSSRALTFKVVALPGLTDGIWPQPMRSDLADAPTSQAALANAGLTPTDRRSHLAEQRFLLYMAATRASQRLMLTRPAADEDGRPLCASPFWTETMRATCGDRPPAAQRVTARDCDQPPEEASSREALRRAAMTAIASPNRRDLAVVAAADALDPTLRPALHAAAVILERESPNPFGRFDGVLSDPRIVDALSAAYPSARPLSITSLERFAQCPFWFFAETVCRLGEVEPPEETLLDDQAGLLYHDILCEFYVALRKDSHAGTRLNRVPLDRLRAEMSRAVDRVFARRAGYLSTTLPALLAIQKEDIRQRLLAYVEAEAKRCAALPYDLEPRIFEWSFGMTVRPGSADESTESPAVVDSPYGPIRLRGRVDRIDRATGANATNAWLEVVDYKSGGRPGNLTSRIRDGLVLQLPLYLLAADQLLSSPLEAAAGLGAYYYLRDLKHQVGVALANDKPEQGRAILDAAAAKAVEAIAACRHGCFPPVPATDCPSYCPYGRLCRTARWRIELKASEAEA
jgi:ATP-dependent helicase/nuclease subunit B